MTFALDVPVGAIPMHVFDTVDAFRAAMERTVRDALRQGLQGWEVTDCAVTMTDSDYQAPPRRWPGTTLSDYRLLTPLVLMDALRRAGTTVCEPVLTVHLEFPADVLGSIMATLIDAGATPGAPAVRGRVGTLDAEIRAARLHDLQSATARPHPGRRRAGVDLRRLPTRHRCDAVAPAHRPQPARPRRLPPAPQGRGSRRTVTAGGRSAGGAAAVHAGHGAGHVACVVGEEMDGQRRDLLGGDQVAQGDARQVRFTARTR